MRKSDPEMKCLPWVTCLRLSKREERLFLFCAHPVVSLGLQGDGVGLVGGSPLDVCGGGVGGRGVDAL